VPHPPVSTNATGIILFSINFFCYPIATVWQQLARSRKREADGTEWRNKLSLDVPAAGPRLISPIMNKKKAKTKSVSTPLTLLYLFISYYNILGVLFKVQ